MRRVAAFALAVVVPALIMAALLGVVLPRVAEIQRDHDVTDASVQEILAGVQMIQNAQTELLNRRIANLNERLSGSRARLGARIQQLTSVIRQAGLGVPPPPSTSSSSSPTPRTPPKKKSNGTVSTPVPPPPCPGKAPKCPGQQKKKDK